MKYYYLGKKKSVKAMLYNIFGEINPMETADVIIYCSLESEGILKEIQASPYIGSSFILDINGLSTSQIIFAVQNKSYSSLTLGSNLNMHSN